MEEVETAHEEISDSQEQEIVVVEMVSRVPGDDEYGAGNNDGENFSDTVEKKIVVNAAGV